MQQLCLEKTFRTHSEFQRCKFLDSEFYVKCRTKITNTSIQGSYIEGKVILDSNQLQQPSVKIIDTS